MYICMYSCIHAYSDNPRNGAFKDYACWRADNSCVVALFSA